MLQLIIHDIANQRVNTIDLTYTVFTGGEINISIKPLIALFEGMKDVYAKATLRVNLTSSNDVMALMMAAQAIKANYIQLYRTMTLSILYTPYGRQDRVCNDGEAFSLKVFADMINSLELPKVEILEPHSMVTPALINNSVIKTIDMMINDCRFAPELRFDYDTVIAPDAGAEKRAMQVAKFLGHELVVALKERDSSTMEIVRTNIYGDVKGKRCLMVDDICDGGRTFINLAKILREQGASSVALLVAHGIFSYGFTGITEVIDKVYTFNSFVPVGAKDNINVC